MTRIKQRLFLLSLLFLVISAPTLAEETSSRTLSPYFLILGGDSSLERFPLKATDVDVTISGVIADVVVRQTYANQGTEPINARYVFPGSTRASVHGMTMTLDDEVVVARIKEREAAKQEFEAAKSQGKSASLLEQQRPNVFTMSVANIMPGDVVEVELHYTELLVPEEGTYEFIYPTVVGPRYSNQPEATARETDRWVQSPYLKSAEDAPDTFDINVTLSAGLPLEEVLCSSHTVDVSWQDESVASVNLVNPDVFGGDRDYILRYRLSGREIQSGLMLYEGEEENFFLLTVQPPERVRQADIPPREYIFVIDVSGSMDGFPLQTATSLIKGLIGHLRETDLFNILFFAGGSHVLSPESLPATQQNLEEAIWMIDRQRGGGGAGIVPALENALKLPRNEEVSRTVVVITDGYVSVERQVFDLIRENLNRTNFFSFGIGTSVNRYLVEGIARAGVGEPFIVTRPEEAEAAAARFRRYIESPVLTHLNVAFNGFEAYDVEPPVLPDLFAQRPIVLFGKYRGRRSGEIQVTGMRAVGPYVQSFRAKDVKPLEENAALRYLWARTRIARLSDFNFGEEDADLVSQITSLGLTYSLLTRYTSFIAVVETIRNPLADATDVDQPLPLPQGVSVLAVGYSAGTEPGLWALLLMAAFLAGSFAFLRRRASASRAG